MPIPDSVGWAVIDYIKNGRPSYYDTDIIFLKHMPPFNPIGDNNHMEQIIVKYMRKAGIDRRSRKRSGFHSLRHSAGSMLLEMDTPLPVISNILGHSDPDITSVYLKTDLDNHSRRVSSMRVFCKYLNDVGVPAYIPPSGMVKHPPKYDAHIYTDDELKAFFEVVDKSQSVGKECPYRSLVMPVFFRILYTSGLRVSELRLLKIKDFNLNENYICIRNAKNNKDRLVPIHKELVDRCKELKKQIHPNADDNEYFFIIRPGVPLSLENVYKNFRRYLEKAGIPHTGRGPRVHDFRHTYCVNLLRKWTDEGKDLMVYLPYMRTMLGHESFDETAYYLKLTTDRFPYIKDQLKSSFPDIISEVIIDENEFY